MTAERDLDAILTKVQRLLNTEGRTPEEAAAYVEKAHELLAKYDLTIEDVGQLHADPRTSIRKSDAVTEAVEGKPDGWKADLLFAVARAFECRVLTGSSYGETKSGRYRRTTTYRLVGFGHDVEAAHYAHSFLVGEITRLGKAHSRVMWDAIKQMAADRGFSVHYAERRYVSIHGTHPLKAELYFIRGAAEVVSSTLMRDIVRKREAATRADDNPNALVLQKSAAVDDWVYQDVYGMTKAEYRAKYAASPADLERWEAERRAKEAAEAARLAKMSPERRERLERERIEKEQRRRDREYRKYLREQEKIDHDAVRAGRAAGATISIRPGVRPGADREEIS